MISSSYINLVKLAITCPNWVSVWKLNFLTLIPAVGGKAQKLPLHRIDLGEICRDEVIPAALAGHHLKTTVHEGRGGTCAAQMDESGEILLDSNKDGKLTLEEMQAFMHGTRTHTDRARYAR